MGTLTPLFSFVHDFLLVSLPDEQKCSLNTICSYRKSLDLLFDFIKTKRNISLSEITFEMIDRNAVSEFYGKQAREICKENVHPHLFRHSWAMILYQNDVDLTLTSQGIGHSNLETTLIYAHADTELKRKTLEQAVPDDSPLKEHLNATRYKVSD